MRAVIKSSRVAEGIAIVICCSEEDRTAIEAAAQPLVDEGHKIRFVDGIADQPRKLAPVIEAFERQGLYVLCRSKGLGRAAIEELREVLLAQQVPFSRTLTVAATRPGMVTDRIRGSLGRIVKTSPPQVTARPGPTVTPKTSPAPPPPPVRTDAPTDSAPTPGDFVPYADSADPPTRRQSSGVQAHRDKPAAPHDSQAGDDSPPAGNEPDFSNVAPSPPEEASPPPPFMRTEDSVVAPLPQSSSVELARAKKSPAPGDRHEDSSAHMAASISDIDLSDLDYGDTSIGRAPAGPDDGTAALKHASIGLRTGETAIARLDELGGGTVRARTPQQERMTPREVAGPGASMSIATLPPRAASPSLSPSPEPLQSSPHISPNHGAPAAAQASVATGPRTGIGPKVWIAAGIGLAGLLALAVVCSVGGSAGEHPDGVSNDDGPKTLASRSKGDSDDATANGGQPSDTASANPPSASDDNDDDVLIADDTDEPGHDDGPPSPVLAAIQRRSVRALDVLLVTTATGGVIAWDKARDYCGSLTVDALVDWRLPDLGELRSLGSAGMLRSVVTYWSATPADTFGDEHLAWFPRRARVVASAPTAQTICVRGERASS